MQRQRAEASEGKIAKLPKLRAATAKGPTEKHTHTLLHTSNPEERKLRATRTAPTSGFGTMYVDRS